MGTGSIVTDVTAHGPFAGGARTITDTGSLTSYKVNSPAGEYGILKENVTGVNVGLIYYQAGIAVLTSSIFNSGTLDVAPGYHVRMTQGAGGDTAEALLTGSTIDVFADAVRRRIKNVSFNNTTELNSSIFFCRANHDEFNYSSNPTYLTGSKISFESSIGVCHIGWAILARQQASGCCETFRAPQKRSNKRADLEGPTGLLKNVSEEVPFRRYNKHSLGCQAGNKLYNP